MKTTTINNITITEGTKYKHIKTNVIYEIVVTREGKFKFDNGIISRTVTPERLNKVKLI